MAGCLPKIKLNSVKFNRPNIDNSSSEYRYFKPSLQRKDYTKFELSIHGYFTISDFFAYFSKKTDGYSYVIPTNIDKYYFYFVGSYSIDTIINNLQKVLNSNFMVILSNKTIVVSSKKSKKDVVFFGEDVELSDKCEYDSGVTLCEAISIVQIDQLKQIYRFKTANAYDVKYDLMIYRFSKEQYKKFLINVGFSDGSSSVNFFDFTGNIGATLPNWFLNLDILNSDSESSLLFKSSFTARTAKEFLFKNVDTIQVLDSRTSDSSGSSQGYKEIDVGQILKLNSFLVKKNTFRVHFEFENSSVTNYDLNKNPIVRKFELSNDLKLSSNVWYLVSSLRSNSVNYNTQINGFYNEVKSDYFVVFFKIS